MSVLEAMREVSGKTTIAPTKMLDDLIARRQAGEGTGGGTGCAIDFRDERQVCLG